MMMTSLQQEVNRALSTLTDREAEVISSYFGLNGSRAMSLEEIGDRFQLTRERVRQIKEKATRRLRHVSRSKALKAYLG
jgi:RNA polymerase primary sigma factor